MRGYSLKKEQEAEQQQLQSPASYRVRIESAMLLVHLPSRSDRSADVRIDLSSYRLPATAWASQGCSLADRPDLVKLIVDSVTIYLRRNGTSKSSQMIVGNIVNSLAKLFEYGWLHGCYKISDWTPGRFAELSDSLSKGGWHRALDLDSRISAFITHCSNDELVSFVNSSKGISSKFFNALNTNAGVKEVTASLPMLTSAFGKSLKIYRPTKTSANGMSSTMLRQTLSWINLLADLPDRNGLAFTPYENVLKLSRSLGRPIGRTDNMAPEEAAMLLREAHAWIHVHSIPALKLLDQLTQAAVDAAGDLLREHKLQSEILRTSVLRLEVETSLDLEKLVLYRTSHKPVGHLSLKKLCQGMFDAAFITIGFFNARRVGEIQDPNFGLYRGALRVFDPLLNLYDCDFYLEKYTKDYRRFFVNTATVQAIRVLERMSEMAVRMREARGWVSGKGNNLKESKICQIPQFICKKYEPPRWFQFNAGPDGNSRFFFDRAVGVNAAWHVRPHMLRRGYALVFAYRYENYEFLALSAQLDHCNPSSTWTYITDADQVEARVPLTRFKHSAKDENVQKDEAAILNEIEIVSHEKLYNFVDAVLNEKDITSGGLRKFILKAHQKFSRRIDYAKLDSQTKSESLTKAMEDRGHRLVPFRHGDCGAPFEKRARLGRCFDESVKSLDRSVASPIVCHKCSYHRAAEGHVVGLVQEKKFIEACLVELPEGALRRKYKIDVENLEFVIGVHREKMDEVEHGRQKAAI